VQKTGKLNCRRIKEARLFRKMTLEELANKVGIQKQAISQFENEKATPEPTTLTKIADILRFPLSFFFENDEPTTVGNTYFRALYSSRKKDLVAQQIKAKYLSIIYFILSKKLTFRPLNLPIFTESITTKQEEAKLTIEKIAVLLREHWRLGDNPIQNMVSLLEQNGIVVGEFSTDSREIDAFYQYCELSGKPTYCIVLGTDKKSFYRRQFNSAHELGHIVLHECYADLDEIDRDEFRTREAQANSFAASFLLPESSFGKDVSVYPNRLSYYLELKKKWNVSIMAMIMRANALGYLSKNQYVYLMRRMSEMGYREKEPLDDYVPYKHPRALKQAIAILKQQEQLTNQQIMELFSTANFSIPENVVEELLDLEKGTLAPSFNEDNIVLFPTLNTTRR